MFCYVIWYPELVKYLKTVKFSQKCSQSHSTQGHRALTNSRVQMKRSWSVSWKDPVSGPKEQIKSLSSHFLWFRNWGQIETRAFGNFFFSCGRGETAINTKVEILSSVSSGDAQRWKNEKRIAEKQTCVKVFLVWFPLHPQVFSLDTFPDQLWDQSSCS